MIDKSKKISLIFLGLFVLGALIRAIDVYRPVDGRVRESWRECDYAAIARNYYQEDMNILYPRIDWRGDGPGFAEMEFPIFPWLVAVMYKYFGFNEYFGRFLSYFFSLLTLLVFFQFSRYLLKEIGAIFASLFFVLSPLHIRVSNSLQPEGLMILFYILGAYAFIRWLDSNSNRWYVASLISTALAILVKINAAHIGFLFLALILIQKGTSGFKNVKAWIFGLLSLLPAALWYAHAHRLWIVYGNSLGVSNEYHWIGLDFFTNPAFLIRLARIEIIYVWMPFGALVALFSLIYLKSERTVKIGILWLLSIFIYYLITIRTTADNWATYYHVVSIPPAALLFGFGIGKFENFFKENRFFKFSVNLILSFVILIILGRIILKVIYPHFFISAAVIVGISFFCAFILFLNNLSRKRLIQFEERNSVQHHLITFLLIFFVFSTFLFQSYRINWDLLPDNHQKQYECAQSFKPFILKNTLIVASGATAKDSDGYPVAYNASYMFYWLEAKGFNISHQDQSVAEIEKFRQRGAGYFVLEKSELSVRPEFFDELQKKYTLLAECDKAYLFRLISQKG